MGSGNIDIGNTTATRQPGRPIIERLNRSDRSAVPQIAPLKPQKSDRPGNCGAMSQQSGYNGNISAPQKFVRLIGYRQPKAGPERQSPVASRPSDPLTE